MNYYGQKLRYAGFVPVDPSSPKIQEIASWAISKYNNEHVSSYPLFYVNSKKKYYNW